MRQSAQPEEMLLDRYLQSLIPSLLSLQMTKRSISFSTSLNLAGPWLRALRLIRVCRRCSPRTIALAYKYIAISSSQFFQVGDRQDKANEIADSLVSSGIDYLGDGTDE